MSNDITPFICDECGSYFAMGTIECPRCASTHSVTTDNGTWTCACGQIGQTYADEVVTRCPFDRSGRR